ncbi:MAG TPA: hypothetical protein VKA95_06000, partial [Nitrososphaeraceae archaeon]|nr:hypothetical protein [Nitrososphaeraceae archaeon]
MTHVHILIELCKNVRNYGHLTGLFNLKSFFYFLFFLAAVRPQVVKVYSYSLYIIVKVNTIEL